MKWWIVVLMCWGLMMFLILNASYAAPPIPFVDDSKFVTIPVIQTENGQLWEARLQCTVDMTNCVVVYAKEICQPNITHFSPSFCHELNK